MRTLERKMDPYRFIDLDDQESFNYEDDEENSSEDLEH